MKSITVIRTSDLSLHHSVRSYIDGCAYEYSVTDDWTKIAQLAYRLKRGANLLSDFLEDIDHWQVQLLWSNTLRTYFFIVNNA